MTFRDLKYGDVFIVEGDPSENIYCKTPHANMLEFNNKYNGGAFCSAVIVGSDNEYIQCWPDAICRKIDIKIKGNVVIAHLEGESK